MENSTDSNWQQQDLVSKIHATILNLSAQFIQSSAHKAIYVQERKNDEFVILCVEVDDGFGSKLVQEMMPDENWQQIRDRGEKPLMQWIGSASMCYDLAEDLPDLEKELTEPPPSHAIKVIIIASGACKIYYVKPMAQFGLN